MEGGSGVNIGRQPETEASQMTKFTSAVAAGMLAAVAMTSTAALAATPKDTIVIATSIDDIV